MRQRQVEVLAGEHLVAARDGALVVVAHRGKQPLTADASATSVWRELDGLISEALDIDGEYFGRAFVRLVSRWAGEQDDDVEFGVISPVENGLAVFLHGDVSAVAGETIRGRDAAVSVDRIVRSPGPVGLFVDTADLPARRGVASLVEGVAIGSGAVIWPAETDESAPDSGVSQSRRPDRKPRAERPRVEKPKTRPQQPKPDALMHSADAEMGATRKSSVIVDDDETSVARPVGVPAAERREPLPAPKEHVEFRSDDKPGPRRAPLPRGRSGGQPPVELPVAAKVRGVRCARGHLNDPRVAFCRLCGLRMNETQIISEGERPTMGFLVLDDGMTFILNGNCVIGREPEGADAVRNGATPIRLSDRAGGLSRAHAEIVLFEWDVAVVDLGSTNGTHVRLPGQPDWRTLTPRQPMILVPGAEISIGGRTITFDSPHAHM